jgi:hypothetical protein
MAKKLKIKKKKKVEEVVTEKHYETLDEVVDKNRPYSMIYSGVENKSYFEILYNAGIRNFLMSFHYVQNKHLNMDYYTNKGIKLFIDSGAYTYITDPKYKEFTVEQWEKQIKQYLNWARKHKDIIFAIANMDLEFLVGEEQVRAWNVKYFEPFMLETGIPVCFIWHETNGAEGWEFYCKRYPYTGLSFITGANDLGIALQMFKVAEKYDTLVHGMGMTRTNELQKLPFYTSDSTTWLVGLQYGEINYWTGTKMTRLKKEKWKGEYLPKIVSLGCDREKLLDEDIEEMIKANIKAFIDAEKYIQMKLQPRMYWLKAKAVTQSMDDITFPDIDWLRSEQPTDLEEWAKKFNVNPNLGFDDLLAIIQDMTVILNWDDEELQEYKEEYYKEDYIQHMHDTWVNTIVTSFEQKVEDLQTFFRECIEGKNDRLLQYGTGFDRIAKEREHYMEEEEYEYHDMTEDELAYELSNSGLLPEPSEDGTAPEIDELDDEIYSNLDIVPVRDEKGRFLKGQKRVRKPKKVYSDKYPKLFCDTCYSASTCPEYAQGMVCAFKKMFGRFDTRDANDVMDAMYSMVNMNLERMQRASIFEMLDGGIPTANVTNLINQNMGLLRQITDMQNYAPREVIKQTHTVRSDGSRETVTQVNNAGSNGGILAELFKDFGKAETDNDDEVKDIMAEKEKLDKDNVIDVEGKEVD